MQAAETKAIIPAELMEQVEKLLSGAEIVKIENDLQLESIVSLGKQVKAVSLIVNKFLQPLDKTPEELSEAEFEKLVSAIKNHKPEGSK